MEFLKAVVFVLRETLMQLDDINAVKHKHTQQQGCDVTEEIMRKQINDQRLCLQSIINTYKLMLRI